uniref:Pyrin domain-containing protein n=1 Tax=Amphiprion percula TaxID=161767 RepID=A0A3P8SCN5_AMPPE
MGVSVLLNILDELDEDQLSTFQWFLQKPNNVQGLPAITKSRLQTLDRCKTVDVMVETYGLQRAVQVTRVVLEKISRNDLLQRFPASSSGPEGQSQNKNNMISLQSERCMMVLLQFDRVQVLSVFPESTCKVSSSGKSTV